MAHFAYTILLLPLGLLIGSIAHRTPRTVQGNTEQLLFLSDRAGGGRWDIFCVDTDGSNLRQLARDFGRHMAPAWSPDGRRIAFNSERHGDEAAFDIYTVAATAATCDG